MKAVICGGRFFSDEEYLYSSLNQCKKWWNLKIIITGGADGADTLAHHWALSQNLETIRKKADWNQYGKSAGMIRNKEMLLLEPDVVIAFKGGPGTENMITISRKAGVPVLIL